MLRNTSQLIPTSISIYTYMQYNNTIQQPLATPYLILKVSRTKFNVLTYQQL